MATWGTKGESAIFKTYVSYVLSGDPEVALRTLRENYPMWLKPGTLQSGSETERQWAAK